MFICPVPKISQVMIKINGTTELHISVDLLCDSTAAELHNSGNLLHISVDLPCSTMAAELHNSVDLLCDTTAAELHNSVNFLCGTTAAELARSCRHFSKTGTNHAEKYEGLIQSKI